MNANSLRMSKAKRDRKAMRDSKSFGKSVRSAISQAFQESTTTSERSVTTSSETILIDEPKSSSAQSFQYSVKKAADVQEYDGISHSTSKRSGRSPSRKRTTSSKNTSSTQSVVLKGFKQTNKAPSTSTSAMYVTIPWASVEKPYVPDKMRKKSKKRSKSSPITSESKKKKDLLEDYEPRKPASEITLKSIITASPRISTSSSRADQISVKKQKKRSKSVSITSHTSVTLEPRSAKVIALCCKLFLQRKF